MNAKQRIDKRYIAPTDAHTSKWERLSEYKIGRRKLTVGQVVKIHGVRAAEFEFIYGERQIETGSVNLTFVGGRNGHLLTRTFSPERVGAFVRVSQHIEEKE